MESKKGRWAIAFVIILVLFLLCVFICKSCTNGDESVQSKDVNVEAEEKTREDTQNSDEAEPSTQDEAISAEEKDTVPEKQEAQTSSSKSKEKKSSSTEQHTHNWVKSTTTVHHDATGHYENVCVKEAWTESVPVYETVCLTICSVCGADITGNTTPHLKAHALAYEGGGHHAEYVQKQTGTQTISHPAEYNQQWVVDKEAWDETVVTYKCSCGATQ